MAAPSSNGAVAATDRQAEARARQAEAKAVYRASIVASEPLSGAELGRRYGMSPQWGRALAAEVQAESNGHRHGGANGVAVDAPAAPGGAIAIAGDRHGGDMAAPERPWWATLVTVVVALLAAAASYGHQLEVALLAGEPELIARGLPLTVDGLVVAALWAGRRGRWWLAIGLAVSMAANVAAAEPTAVGYAVAGWPPVALLGTHRLLHR